MHRVRQKVYRHFIPQNTWMNNKLKPLLSLAVFSTQQLQYPTRLDFNRRQTATHKHDTQTRSVLTRSVCGSENVKSAHPAGRLRISNIKCSHAACHAAQRCSVLPGPKAGSVVPQMTSMDLQSLQFQSCSDLSPRWPDDVLRL